MRDRSVVSFREAISTQPDDFVIFGYELLSQPDDSLDRRIPGIRQRNEVIIANAEEKDVVLLAQPATPDYHRWLRSVGFSTDNIYVLKDPQGMIPDMVDDPDLAAWLDQFKGNRIYAARYSSDSEVRAAETLGARLFGCDSQTTLRFYDKASFRKICKEMKIPIVDGEEIEVTGDLGYDVDCLRAAIEKYSCTTGRAIIKDLTCSAGANIWTASSDNMFNTMRDILSGGPRNILIETMVETITEPNDNWAVTLDGRVIHIGISDQLVMNNMHSGNEYPCSSANIGRMLEMSEVIGRKMLEDGYTGLFGIDYLEDESGNVFVSENNSRVNGSTHAWDVVRKLEKRHGEIGSFVLYQLRDGNPMSFDELASRTEDMLYDGNRKYCFFPLDIGLLSRTGAMNILTTGEDYREARGMLDTVLGRLGQK